jgi:predicted  nucleic acid-binding Zn-ribbon protein
VAAEQNEQVYDQIAREAIEHALGRTFENPEAVPRRDAFIRDATDLLARFVAARCGNPGFHSARFFDAVIALSNARTRIRDAARRSRVVERLVEAERRVRALENALRDRNEQLVQASSGSDATTLARAISDADARIRTLEHELSEARNRAADLPPRDERRDDGITAPTRQLDQLDAEEIFRDSAEGGDEAGEETGHIQIEVPGEPARREPPRDPITPTSRPRDLEPERRLAGLKAELDAKTEEARKLHTEKEQVELERDALQAQIEQIAAREAPLREAKAAVGRERDALVARVADLEKELEQRVRELSLERDSLVHDKALIERERDEIVRSRSSLGELKRQVEQELALAQQDREQLRGVAAEKEAARTRAIAEGERAHEARRGAEARIDRESTAAARARRERDEARGERDRLRAVNAELGAFKDRWEQLSRALGADPQAPIETVLDVIARRHEVVLAHEPPAWDELRSRLERLGAKDGLAQDARAWVARLEDARGRYEKLVAGATNGGVTASALMEIARIVTAREEESRALDLLESVVARI